MAIAPDLSLRGRFAPVAISQYPTRSQESHRRKRNCLPEIATAPLGPRNDKSGNLAPRNHYCNTCNCQWRSMSALQGGNTYGTNSLAQCHQVCHCEEAAGRRGNLAVPGRIVGKLSAKTQLPSRDCHVGLWPPRNDKLGSLTHLPEIPPDLQLPKAVTDRRYRRNWCIPFSRWPVQIGSASPRLHPEGTSSRFALRAPRRPLASSQ